MLLRCYVTLLLAMMLLYHTYNYTIHCDGPSEFCGGGGQVKYFQNKMNKLVMMAIEEEDKCEEEIIRMCVTRSGICLVWLQLIQQTLY